MELHVQLLSGMSGLQENCGDGNYPREVRRLSRIICLGFRINVRLLEFSYR